ncbi:MAG: hypothetical protein JWR12_1496 [Mucilaginibacter sp.]|nr:hypothetical protein [Mucilaginibacter sp.]
MLDIKNKFTKIGLKQGWCYFKNINLRIQLQGVNLII